MIHGPIGRLVGAALFGAIGIVPLTAQPALDQPRCHGTKSARHRSAPRDNLVLRTYGLPVGAHRDYEIDHYIPLCLGGPDATGNLWPMPRRSIVPYAESAEAKDVQRMAALPRGVRWGAYPAAGD